MSLATATLGDSERRPKYVPKLTYRNSATADSLVAGPRQSTSTIGTHYTEFTVPTISTDPTSGPPSPAGTWARPTSSYQSSVSLNSPRSSHSPAPPAAALPRKKSLFGGLFATKEPSMAAFEQMKQMEAANPNLKLYTSRQKLPKDAPKVDSKWDGMPKSYRKENPKSTERPTLNRQSYSSSGRSATSDDRRKERRHSASTLGSFSSGGRGRTRDRTLVFDTQHGNPSASSGWCSSTAGSTFGESETRGTGASTRAASLKSPSLPDLSGYFLDEVAEPSKTLPKFPEPKGFRSTQSSIPLADRLIPQPLPTVVEPPSEQTPSPKPTPSPRVSGTKEPPPGITRGARCLPTPETGNVGPPPGSAVGPRGRDSAHTGQALISKTGSVANRSREMSDPGALIGNVRPADLGYHGPPASEDGMPEAYPFLAGEAQPLELSDDDDDNDDDQQFPKKAPTSKRSSAQTGPPASSYMARLGDLEQRPDSSRHRLGLGASAWRSYKVDHGDNDETARPTPPLAVKSTGLFKSPKLGIFKSPKAER